MTKLNVAFESSEVEVPINAFECDYCHRKVSQYESVSSAYYDQTFCDACWETAND